MGLAVEEEVVFFQLNGLILALYSRAALAQDVGVPDEGNGVVGISLAHNARSEAEVDRVLSAAGALSDGMPDWFGLGPASVK